MYDVEKRSAVLEDAAGLRDAYMYGPVTKWRHWGMLIRLHCGRKLRVPPNAVGVEMPPALSS